MNATVGNYRVLVAPPSHASDTAADRQQKGMEREFYTKGRACAKAQKKETEELYRAQVERSF